ncbi:hypothetical protein [Lentzea sp. NPDC060358]|uniref:hypothetical protein n=1 Tax=Lentzea sp. NPDC060358 TaxID=3347103 RepID=UPI0036646E90
MAVTAGIGFLIGIGSEGFNYSWVLALLAGGIIVLTNTRTLLRSDWINADGLGAVHPALRAKDPLVCMLSNAAPVANAQGRGERYRDPHDFSQPQSPPFFQSSARTVTPVRGSSALVAVAAVEPSAAARTPALSNGAAASTIRKLLVAVSLELDKVVPPQREIAVRPH